MSFFKNFRWLLEKLRAYTANEEPRDLDARCERCGSGRSIFTLKSYNPFADYELIYKYSTCPRCAEPLQELLNAAVEQWKQEPAS